MEFACYRRKSTAEQEAIIEHLAKKTETTAARK